MFRTKTNYSGTAPPAEIQLMGDAEVPADASLLDFWKWGFGDICDDDSKDTSRSGWSAAYWRCRSSAAFLGMQKKETTGTAPEKSGVASTRLGASQHR